jgi:endonuclease YncB( thermonuclease family)
MASVFSHRDDAIIRPGDYVRTTTTDGSTTATPGPRGGANLSRASIYSSSGRNSAPPLSMPSSGARQQRRSKAGDPVPPSNVAIHGSDRSAVCDMFKADTSSLDAWWTTMTRGTWLQQSTEATRVGVVRSVNMSQKTMDVTIWMLGDRCLVDLPKKPVETYPVGRLEKLSVFEFNDICRKKYMHEMAHHLKLRGEGYDESAPFALIAHNNRVISDLIGKIDTTAKLSMKDIVVRRPRGPADLIKRPIPVMVPIEDPLAAARGELQALQESGLVQGTRRRRHHTSNLSSQHKSASDDTLVHGTDRCVSTSMMSGHGTNDGPTTATPSLMLQSANSTNHNSTLKLDVQRSFFEHGVTDETSTTQRNLRASSALTRPNAGLRTRQPLVPDAFFVDPRLTASGNTGSRIEAPRNQRKAFLTSVHSIDASVMERHFVMCTVVDVMEPRGYILLRPSRSSQVPFVASLAFVDVWQDRAAIDAIRALTSVEVKVVPLSRDLYGNCMCEVYVNGECLAETLLGEGLATLNVSALDCEMSRFRSNQSTHYRSQNGMEDDESEDDNDDDRVVPERIDALQAAQDRASRERFGVWEELLQVPAASNSGGDNNNGAAVNNGAPTVANMKHVVGDSSVLMESSLREAGARRGSSSLSSLPAPAATTPNDTAGRRRGEDTYDNHLPPLFGAFESSHAFRQKVVSTLQQS